MTDTVTKPARLFDMTLRVDAAGPRGIAQVNNLAFFAAGPRYLLRRMERFTGQTVVPITNRHGSVVLVRGRAAARQVFTDNETFHRPDGLLDLPPGRPWSRMFEAVLSANGSEHTRRRKLIMPAVHRSAVEHFTDVFAMTFAESRFAQRGRFDARAECLRISKANMLRCLLGIEPTDELSAMADAIVRLGGDALSPGVLAMKRDLSWTPYGRWLRRVAWAYERLVVLIEQRRGEEPRADALSILCHTTDESGDRLTTDEIVGELHSFFAAGFETTAMTMAAALLPLLGSPDPDGAEVPDVTDPVQLDAAVKEAQRIIAVVPVTLPRRAVVPVTVGETAVPAGSLVFVSSLLEHRNPEVYPEPTHYRPSRWTEQPPKPYEFFPFGLGPRRCLGAEFADAQVRATLRLIAERGLPTLVSTEVDYGTVNGVVAGPRKPIVVDTSNGRPARITGSVTAVWQG
jgi:cytochrome P450